MPPPIFRFGRAPIIRQPENLYLASSPIHGLGVFSKIAIFTSTLVEVAPILIGSERDYELLSATAIRDYYFMLADRKFPIAIGLGFSSWYNHACPANANYSIDVARMLIKIKAATHIKAHDEITINYHGKFDCELPVEF